MEQHPIPQNVSSYQFKLVGDMTLKQFFQLAGGILVGLLFWSLPLLLIIRGPLAGLSILLGIGMAFLPFEERPLEKWIFAFFRAIYSPTIFTWQKGSFSARVFQDEPNQVQPGESDTALKDYLSKTNIVPQATGNLDKAEGNFFARLVALATGIPQAIAQPAPTPSIQTTKDFQIPVAAPVLVVQQTPPPEAAPIGRVIPDTAPPIEAKNVQAEAPKFTIPQTPVISIPHTSKPVAVDPMPSDATRAAAISNTAQPVIMGNEIISTKQAIFSVDAAPPSPPTYPNVVVGQVVDQDRKIVEGVIMEIRDSAGRPIRALRSNKAGHFITVTQLDNGHYEIITEKDGYEFETVGFDATGSIIPPILVQGKRLGPPVEEPSIIVKPAYSIN